MNKYKLVLSIVELFFILDITQDDSGEFDFKPIKAKQFSIYSSKYIKGGYNG